MILSKTFKNKLIFIFIKVFQNDRSKNSFRKLEVKTHLNNLLVYLVIPKSSPYCLIATDFGLFNFCVNLVPLEMTANNSTFPFLIHSFDLRNSSSLLEKNWPQLVATTWASYLNISGVSSVFAAILSSRMCLFRLSYKRDIVTVAAPDFCQSRRKRTHKFTSPQNRIKSDLFVKSATFPFRLWRCVVHSPLSCERSRRTNCISSTLHFYLNIWEQSHAAKKPTRCPWQSFLRRRVRLLFSRSSIVLRRCLDMYLIYSLCRAVL